MRVLKTEDCFYVAGGNASDTNSGNFGDVGNMGESAGVTEADRAEARGSISPDQALALANMFGNITAGPRSFNNPVSQGGSVLGAGLNGVRSGLFGSRSGPEAESPAPNYDAFGNQQAGGTFGGDGGPKN